MIHPRFEEVCCVQGSIHAGACSTKQSFFARSFQNGTPIITMEYARNGGVIQPCGRNKASDGTKELNSSEHLPWRQRQICDVTSVAKSLIPPSTAKEQTTIILNWNARIGYGSNILYFGLILKKKRMVKETRYFLEGSSILRTYLAMDRIYEFNLGIRHA